MHYPDRRRDWAVAAGHASILCRVVTRFLYHSSNARFSRHAATQAYPATAIEISTQSATALEPAAVSSTRSSAPHPVRCTAGFHQPSASGDQFGQFPYASQLIHCAPPIRNGAQITGIKARANPIRTAARLALGSFIPISSVYLTRETGTMKEVAFAPTEGLGQKYRLSVRRVGSCLRERLFRRSQDFLQMGSACEWRPTSICRSVIIHTLDAMRRQVDSGCCPTIQWLWLLSLTGRELPLPDRQSKAVNRTTRALAMFSALR